MRILVLGGTRFIGPRVIARLAGGGHEVIVAHRGVHATVLPAKARELIDQRLGAPMRHLPDELRRCEPEVVLHMMAMGEADALAAVQAFAGVARRIVAPSSGDVYRAYGLLARLEEGDPVATPLHEDSALRASRYPYRKADTPPSALEYTYDKILAERALASRSELPATILRLPKVYGPEDDADLATVYGFRHAPQWKWTHGFVENVAKAIAVAILDDRATGRIYNVGESTTPTMAERLAHLPPNPAVPTAPSTYRFEQNVDYDTSRIRAELDYVEDVDEQRVMRQLAGSFSAQGDANTRATE